MDPAVFYRLRSLGVVRARLLGTLDAGLAVDVSAPSAGAESGALVRVTISTEHIRGELSVPLVPLEPAVLLIGPGQRRTFALRTVAASYGITGRAEVDSSSMFEDPEAQEAVFAAAAHRALELLADRLPSLEPESTAHERALSVLLDYATPRARLLERDDHTSALEVSDPLARRVLELPVIATTRGAPISARRVLLEAHAHARGVGLAAALAAPRPGSTLASWLARYVPERAPAAAGPAAQQHNAITSVAGDAARTNTARTAVTPNELARLLESWIAKLRPEPEAEELDVLGPEAASGPAFFASDPRAPLTVELVEYPGGRPGLVTLFDALGGSREEELGDVVDLDREWLHHYLAGDSPRLLVNSGHWLVRFVRREMEERRESFAWLLLSAFGHVNALISARAEADEATFRRRVVALLTGDRFP
jgi:hypothetical protein